MGFFLNLPEATENDVGKFFKRDKRFLSMKPGQIKIFNLNLKAMFKKIIPTILFIIIFSGKLMAQQSTIFQTCA